jgi:hypothetical protein
MVTTSPAQVVITLVHGTWGRGFFARNSRKARRPRWFEPGSDFRRNLDAHLTTENMVLEYDDFQWSGHNSVLERDRAAQSLAKHLRAQTEQFPGYVKLVIAHSHGGTVAMRALHHLQQAVGETIRLVTVATPFVQIFLQYPESHASQSYRRLAIVVGGMFGALSVVSALLLVNPEGPVWIKLIACLSFASMGLFAIPWLMLGRPWFAQRRSAWVNRLIGASMASPRSLAPHKILVLRGVEDEAALVLAFGAFGARLAHTLARYSERCLPFWKKPWLILPKSVVGSDLFLWMVIPAVVVGVDLWVNGTLGTVGTTALVAVAFLAMFVTLSVFGCNVLKSVHGRELLVGGFVCEVTNASAPDSLHQSVSIATLPVPMEYRQPIRHSLYDHRFCFRAIAAWLCNTLDSSQKNKDELGDVVDFLYEGSLKGLAEWTSEIDRKIEEMRKEHQKDRAESAKFHEENFLTDEDLEQEKRDAEESQREWLRLYGNEPGNRPNQ